MGIRSFHNPERLFCVFTLFLASTLGLSLLIKPEDKGQWKSLIDTVKQQIEKVKYKYQDKMGPLPDINVTKVPYLNLLTDKHTLENCGDSSDPVVITYLTLHPDPIPTQGDLYFTLHLTLHEDIEDDLKVAVYSERKQFGNWIPIGCSGYWGTCTFDNVCAMLDKLMSCPSQLMRKMPCKCPFKKGNYEINESKIMMNVKNYAVGTYRSTVQMYHNSRRLACYRLTFDLKSY